MVNKYLLRLTITVLIFSILTGCGSVGNSDVYSTESDSPSASLSQEPEDEPTDVPMYEPVSTGEWVQQEFYLGSGVSPTDGPSLKIMKDAGYNLLEFWDYNSTQGMLEAAPICDELGLYYIMCDKQNINLHLLQRDKLTFTESSVNKAVYNLKDHKNMLGYSVWDEPLLEENGSDNVALSKRMIGYLNKYDPNSLKFMNFLPSYGPYNWEDDTYVQYVETFIKEANPSVVSVDYYPYLMGHSDDESDWWRDLGLFRQMSFKYDKPFWYYYQQVQINGVGPTPTDDEIRYQMYTALAYGAKTLMAWFADVYENGEPTSTFEATKNRNAELMAVGTYLFDKESVNLYHTGLSAKKAKKFYIDNIKKSDLISSAPDGLILSVFKDGKTDTKYLLVVNRDTTSGKSGTIKLKSSKNIGKFDVATNTEKSVGKSKSISFNIPAGGGVVYSLK